MTTCPFCDRGGIPLLPVRLGLSTSDTRLPVIGQPFVYSAPESMDNGRYKYVLRTLRTGYLYVHDEVRKKWSAYVVTPDGYYYAFDPEGAPPRSEVLTFACSREPADVALASCITIPHTKALPAGRVWLAFSDVAWTKKVMALHQDPAHRAKHMRWVDLAGWVGSHQQNFCDKLEATDTAVAEFSLGAAPGAKAFEWSPFPFTAKGLGKPYFQALVDAAKKKNDERAKAGLKPAPLHVQHGMIVRVRDPASVARETTRLLQFKTNEFLTHPSRVRELALSNVVAAIKESVAEQAVKDEIAAAEDLANKMVSDSYGSVTWTASGRKSVQDMREVTPQEAALARARSWDKYGRKIGEDPSRPGQGRRAKFDAQFQQDLAVFESEWVGTLAPFHAKWLADDSMGDYFQYNFDDTDVSHGFAFQALLAQCFEHMADKRDFAAQCEKWLAGDVLDRKNLLLRALVMNNDEFAKKVVGAANAPLDWRTPGWENVGNWFKEAYAAVDKAAYETWLSGKGPADATARFFVQIAGPLTRFLAPQLANPSVAARTALLAMGIVSNSHIVPVDVVGNKDKFRAALVRQLIRSTGQQFKGHQLDKAVADELRRLEVEGVRLEGRTSQRWLLAVDEKTAKAIVADMPSGLTPTQRAQRLVAAVRTPESLEQATSALGKVINMDVRLGVLAAILQCASLSKAMADETSAMAHETEEVKWKLRSAWMGMAGTIVETTMTAVGRLPALQLRAAQGLTAARVLGGANMLKWAGKGLGAAAGIIVAVFDGMHFLEEKRQGNYGLAALYAASAVTGGVLAVGLLLGLITGGVAIVLFVVLVALAVIIEMFKDNKIQDWLERTLWGIEGDAYAVKSNGAYDPARSLEAEMKQLEVAVAN